MKVTLILLLFLWDSVEFTLSHEECVQLPTVDHAFVLDEYKKPQYQAGDVIYFSCDPGYITGVNSTYVCTEQGWRQATNGQCIEEGTFPVRLGCARPPALENGHLVKKSAYVYTDGQTVKYQCDHLYLMKGVSHKTCSNGQWTGDLQCLASFCVAPQIDNGALEEDKKYGQNEVLPYSCNPGYMRGNGRPSVCVRVNSRAAQWSPMPQCEAITCNLSSNAPEGTTYSPQYQIMFRPGQTVNVSCGEKQWVKSKELRSAELTCQADGRWDYDPACQMVTCFTNDENYDEEISNWYGPNTVHLDQTVRYQGYPGSVATSPTGRAKCTRGGWEPNPLCKAEGCTLQSFRQSPHFDENFDLSDLKWSYNSGDNVRVPCRIGYRGLFKLICSSDGLWFNRGHKCSAVSCGHPGDVQFADVWLVKGSNYDFGSQVLYTCHRGYQMTSPTNTRNCLQGGWDGHAPVCERTNEPLEEE